MKRIPFLQWVKMLLIVGAHLWIAWLLMRPHYGTLCDYAGTASEYVVYGYREAEGWTVEKWNTLPSAEELGRQFVAILKKPLE